jgi:S1-C subfamily serine protease
MSPSAAPSAPAPSPAPGTLVDFSAALAALVARVAGAVVSVHSHRTRSSGFVWRPNLIVSADEGVAEEGAISVTLPGGETVPALPAGRDPTTDVALLRVERPDLVPVTLVNAPAGISAPPIVAGALVLAVGAEEGAPTAALGVVSRAAGPWRSLRGGEIDARIEVALRLRRSAEGGLVLDASGRAIGMAAFGPRQRVLVIPAATIERVAAKLASGGRIARGYLGLGLHPIAVGGGSETGAMVLSVDPKGPGASAGVHQGDIIVAWNGQAMRTMPQLMRALGPDSVGQTVTLALRRAGETREVSLTVAERPQT